MEERSAAAAAAVGGEKRVKTAAAAAAAAKRPRPIKVVLISNPMKFKASPSDFPALVQRLTGQGSDIADIMSKYHHPAHDHEQLEATPPPAAAAAPPPPAAAAAAAGGRGGVCPLELLNGAFDSRSPESFPW